MPRQSLDDLAAFLAVARVGSFTHAAPELGVSQSALSHRIRGLEARLGVRLLTRTTRSVAPTEAGERLLRTLGPRFEEIEAELAAVRDLRDKSAGSIRITTAGHALGVGRLQQGADIEWVAQGLLQPRRRRASVDGLQPDRGPIRQPGAMQAAETRAVICGVHRAYPGDIELCPL